MNYKETLEYLYEQLPFFQRIGKAAYKGDLDRTLQLDSYFNHPHTKFRTVHVAGTNGKGSISACLAAVMQMAGYKTGLYTSPHLKDFRERIKINGEKIPEEYVTNFVSKHSSFFNSIKPSFFEITVAMAFLWFKEQEVDIAIIETGLGGRLDSTNIINPELAVISNIGFDHEMFLGNTLDLIAQEKAGIIKQGIPVIIGETQEETQFVFKEVAKERNAPIYFADKEYTNLYATLDMDGNQVLHIQKSGHAVYPDLKTNLHGMYQQKNIVTTLKALDILKLKNWQVPDKALYSGILDAKNITGLRGRWEIIGNNPLVVCDTGHNASGLKQIHQQMLNTAYKNLHIVFGMVKDKDAEKLLGLLPSHAKFYLTTPPILRALPLEELEKAAKKLNLDYVALPASKDALAMAKANAGKNDLIFVGGSTFIVAEILE